jgi:hypothetical protein
MFKKNALTSRSIQSINFFFMFAKLSVKSLADNDFKITKRVAVLKNKSLQFDFT